MLASDRPSNAVAWLAGWTLSTFVIGVLIVLFFGGRFVYRRWFKKDRSGGEDPGDSDSAPPGQADSSRSAG